MARMPLPKHGPSSGGRPHTFGYANGDQLHFSEYYDGYGWFGTLTTLEPGSGYQAKVAAGGSATFQSQ